MGVVKFLHDNAHSADCFSPAVHAKSTPPATIPPGLTTHKGTVGALQQDARGRSGAGVGLSGSVGDDAGGCNVVLQSERRFRAAFRRCGGAKRRSAGAVGDYDGADGGSRGSFRACVRANRAGRGVDSVGVGEKSGADGAFLPRVMAAKCGRRRSGRRRRRSKGRCRRLLRHRRRVAGADTSSVRLPQRLFAARAPLHASRAASATPCLALFSPCEAHEARSGCRWRVERLPLVGSSGLRSRVALPSPAIYCASADGCPTTS